MPSHLVAPGDKGGPEVGVPTAVTDVPLAAGDDFQWLVALLEELHRMGDGLGLADQFAGLSEDLHHLGLGREDRLSGQTGVGGPAGLGVQAGRRLRVDPAGPVDDGPHV